MSNSNWLKENKWKPNYKPITISGELRLLNHISLKYITKEGAAVENHHKLRWNQLEFEKGC